MNVLKDVICHHEVERMVGKPNSRYIHDSILVASLYNVAADVIWIVAKLSKKRPLGCDVQKSETIKVNFPTIQN